jgi:hypothetical protein
MMTVIDLLKSDGPKNPCWKGYEMVGTKVLNGRTVPNCVKKTAKMMSVEDLVKTKDDTGHEHGSDGKFTSGSGKSYTVKDSTGKDDELGHYEREVHGPNGKIGSVKLANAVKGQKYVRHAAVHTANGTRNVVDADLTRTLFKPAQAAQDRMIQSLVEHHEKHGPDTPKEIKEKSVKDAEEDLDAVERKRRADINDDSLPVTDKRHSINEARKHEATIGVLRARESEPEQEEESADSGDENQLGFDFGKRKLMTVADLVKQIVPQLETVNDLVKSGDVVSLPDGRTGPFVGSFEDTLRRISGPVKMGCGCNNKPEYDERGNRIYGDNPHEPGYVYPHYCDVVATFPEHAYVRCSDEDKTWKVPYSFDGDVVETGEPELVAAQFVPINEATGEIVEDPDDDDDEDDEDDDEDADEDEEEA